MMNREQRYRGVVKWFAKNKGFGFIEWREGERDIFVHYSSVIRAGQRNLEQGDMVEFGVQETAEGWQAIHVIPLGHSSPDKWPE